MNGINRKSTKKRKEENYDFKIDKIYNTGGLTLDEIRNKIKETDDLNRIYNLFLFEGEKPKQCVEKPNSIYFELGW